MSSKLPFVDFYSKRGIIPTRQDISDFPRHLERRLSLYRNMGLAPAMLRGASVLEFGPGSGHNALVTALLQPSRYLLVDANPASLFSTRELLAGQSSGTVAELRESPILDFTTTERFDLVLCEGVIPTQLDPAAFLRHVASFTAPGGMVIFTCMDSISVLPEMLKRYVGWHLTKETPSFDDKVAQLVSFFSPDLAHLRGMSRKPEDWVIDQMLHPWGGPMFAIPEALEVLQGHFAILGSSPHFLTDWRWYKDVYGAACADNSSAVKAYESLGHNLIDYRHVYPAHSKEAFAELRDICDKIYERVFAQETTAKDYPAKEISDDVTRISQLAKSWSDETAESLSDFADKVFAGITSATRFGAFTQLWGRGQQYISMVRL
jgi:SAM-dependent methyltransferase